MAIHPNRTTAFDVARLSRTPGVQSTFIFKPSTLTVRIRNAAQKMVRERVLRGQWSSKSRQVAKTVLDALGVSYVGGHNRFLKVPGGLPADVREDLVALCSADMAGYLLDIKNINSRHHDWLRDKHKANQESISNADPHLQLYLEFRDADFARKAANRLGRHYMSLTGLSDTQRAAKAADAFNDPDFSLEVFP